MATHPGDGPNSTGEYNDNVTGLGLYETDRKRRKAMHGLHAFAAAEVHLLFKIKVILVLELQWKAAKKSTAGL